MIHCFQVPQYQLVNPWELVVYALLGLAGGVVSAAFTQFLIQRALGSARSRERQSGCNHWLAAY